MGHRSTINVIFELEENFMDFIERWFHLSPDAGSGATEVALIVAFAMLAAVVFYRRRLAKFARRSLGGNKKNS
jgi:hypothetical protein